MKTPYPQATSRSTVSLSQVVKLERCGKYDDALAEIRHVWPDLSAMPDLNGLDARDAAEMLLRCGSLLGFLGNAKQLPKYQDRSKDLLTQAHERFRDIYDIEKMAECENFIALAYWRQGDLNEASIWIDEALMRDLAETHPTRLYAHVTRLLINAELGLYGENVAQFDKLEPLFRTNGDAFLCGSFYANIGISYQELRNDQKAIKYLELAETWHTRSGHKIYLGTAKNNLAMLYKNLERFDMARKAIDSAAKIFRQANDRTREAYAYDTKAQIHFAAREYAEAVKSADKAIPGLQKSNCTAYLVESYMTKVRSLVFLGDISDASYCLSEAVQITKISLGEKEAKALTKRFEASLLERFTSGPEAGVAMTRHEAENRENDIKLVLPASISHYTDYEGVWITGGHLEKAGVAKGSLAVVVKDKIKKGDLIAIAEKDSDIVRCGFYDADFGMICLEGADSELQLFDEDKVSILGRIVGVCNSGRESDGKMIVEAISI